MKKTARSQCFVKPFSLMEILVALVIMVVVMGVALPRIGRLPMGVRRQQAISTFKNAFRNASMRARATGIPVQAVIMPIKNIIKLQRTAGTRSALNQERISNFQDSENGTHPQRGGLFKKTSEYEFPNGTSWVDKDSLPTEEQTYFTFYPNGEATGPAINIKIGKMEILIDIDRLTGRVIVTQADDI